MFYHHRLCKLGYCAFLPLQVIQKHISDDFDSELAVEDDSKPLTQDELKAKVIKIVCTCITKVSALKNVISSYR